MVDAMLVWALISVQWMCSGGIQSKQGMVSISIQHWFDIGGAILELSAEHAFRSRKNSHPPTSPPSTFFLSSPHHKVMSCLVLFCLVLSILVRGGRIDRNRATAWTLLPWPPHWPKHVLKAGITPSLFWQMLHLLAAFLCRGILLLCMWCLSLYLYWYWYILLSRQVQ